MNKMMVIGNVGNDPEMRYTPNGNPVTSFRVATNRRWNSADGEQHEETEWFSVSTWNRLAETCNQYVTKGMKVYVRGSSPEQALVRQRRPAPVRQRDQCLRSTVPDPGLTAWRR